MTGCLSRILKTGLALVMLAMVTGPLPAPAVTPEEMLADPALESRARALSKQLRCLVCQNQSIDDSDAELARDLRVEVRKQLATGASDAEILATLRETYGDYVLLNPPVSPGTYILWGAPVVILLGGLAIMLAGRRRREGDAAMIADDEAAPASPAASLDRRVALALASLVMAASLGLYLVLGRADLPARPLADRGAELAAAASQAQEAASDRSVALKEARAGAAETPDDVGAWLRLAMAAAAATDSATEIMALEQAERLTGGDPAIRAMRAEAMARAADGQVTIPARELIAGILAVNPAEPRALYLSGLAAYQDEDYAAAVGIWRRLQTLSPPDAPWMTLLAENIADAARSAGIDPDSVNPGPDADAVADAATMTEEERAAMIAGMVEGLAARLADEPGDVAGWRRLIRAYRVLERPEDLQAALIGLADAIPGDIDAQLSALEHMVVARLEAGFVEASQRLLDRVEALDPNRPEGIYISGHFARQAGDTDRARALWEDLYARLPANAPIAPQLRKAIDDL
ncbi:MAG: cytochrome c-type biogenesis protein CcmH [Rhodobiaceae bacterium]